MSVKNLHLMREILNTKREGETSIYIITIYHKYSNPRTPPKKCNSPEKPTFLKNKVRNFCSVGPPLNLWGGEL